MEEGKYLIPLSKKKKLIERVLIGLFFHISEIYGNISEISRQFFAGYSDSFNMHIHVEIIFSFSFIFDGELELFQRVLVFQMPERNTVLLKISALCSLDWVSVT